MKTSFAGTTVLALFMSTGTYAQSDFRVYGFADAQASHYDLTNSYLKQVVYKDEYLMRLSHANIYFDWTPNPSTKAVVEVALFTSNHKTILGMGSEAAVIRYNGTAITSSQAKELLATQTAMHVLESQIPASTANRDAVIQSMLPDAITQVKSSDEYQAATESIDALYQSNSGTSENERRQLEVPRAYFDLLLNEAFNIRFGKWTTPAGIWNVDHGSPVVLTVNQPYQVTITPIFPESQQGFMGYGHVYLGNHELSYNAWISTGRSGANQSVGNAFDNSIDAPSDFTFGGHVSLHLDPSEAVERFKKLSIGATAQTGKMRQKHQVSTLDIELVDLSSLSLADYVFKDELLVDERERIFGGDLKIDLAGFLLQGEANYISITNADDQDFNMLGWYGLMGYRYPATTNVTVTPYAMFEQVTLKNGINTPGLGLYGFGARGFQSMIMGLNFSLFTNFRIKTEFNLVRIMPSDKEADYAVPLGYETGDLDAKIIATQFSVAF